MKRKENKCTNSIFLFHLFSLPVWNAGCAAPTAATESHICWANKSIHDTSSCIAKSGRKLACYNNSLVCSFVCHEVVYRNSERQSCWTTQVCFGTNAGQWYLPLKRCLHRRRNRRHEATSVSSSGEHRSDGVASLVVQGTTPFLNSPERRGACRSGFAPLFSLHGKSHQQFFSQ